MSQRFPLNWPLGWPRTDAAFRKRAKFAKITSTYRPSSTPGGQGYTDRRNSDLSISEATKRVLAELDRMRARGEAIISTNLELRLDGLPRSGLRAPDDPGVAVYWNDSVGRPKVMAIDIYETVAGNLGAVAATLDAMRAIERHGGSQILERAFTGFEALEGPNDYALLGLKKGASKADIDAAFRKLARTHHPDAGGDPGAFASISAARDRLIDGVL